MLNFFASKPYQKKTKQIFIIGVSNCGKTSFINAIFGELSHQKYVFDKNPKFPMDTWDPCRHTHVIADEEHFTKIDTELLKLIVSGEDFTQERRKNTSIISRCCVPMIFIANEKPKNFAGLEERFQFIEADAKDFNHVSDINEYLEWDYSIPDKELPLQLNLIPPHSFSCLKTRDQTQNVGQTEINSSSIACTSSSISMTSNIEPMMITKADIKKLSKQRPQNRPEKNESSGSDEDEERNSKTTSIKNKRVSELDQEDFLSKRTYFTFPKTVKEFEEIERTIDFCKLEKQIGESQMDLFAECLIRFGNKIKDRKNQNQLKEQENIEE